MHFFGWPVWAWAIVALLLVLVIIAGNIRVRLEDALTPPWRRAARAKWRLTYWAALAFLPAWLFVAFIAHMLPDWPWWAWAIIVVAWPFVARGAAHDGAPTGNL